MIARETSIDKLSLRSKLKVVSISVLVLAALVEGYFIIYDLPLFSPYLSFQNKTSTQKQSIAQIMSKKNEIKLQEPNSLIWENTTEHQPLFDQQYVLSQERSKAEIAFLDGTGIVMDENSLIRIEKNSNQQDHLVVRLLRGGIHKRKASTPLSPTVLDIQVNNTLIPASADSELSVYTPAEHPGEIFVQVQQGEVEFKAATKGSGVEQKVKVAAGEEAKISHENNTEPKINIRKRIFVLEKPLENEVFERERDFEVQFSWKILGTITGGTPQVLEISPTPQFNPQEIRQVRIASTEPPLQYVETSVKLPVSAKPTAWFWRVRTAENTPTQSGVRKVWIQRPEAETKPVLIQEMEPASAAPPPPSKIFAPKIETPSASQHKGE